MSSSRRIHALSDGSLLGEVVELEPADVFEVVRKARASLGAWRRAAPHERAAVLARAAEALRAEAPSLALLHAAESGKVLAQARREVLGAASLLDGNGQLAARASGTIAPTGSLPGGADDLTLVERVPLGVVVCVIPFNFPVELTVEKAGAAIAAGNVAIVKPPPQNPLATIRAVERMQAAGIPEGVLQIAAGGTELSAALCAADGVDAVSLTGSVRAGVAVAQASAASLRPLHLELGGNGASIVLPDADLERVVSECLRGRLLMNGQACAATKRIIAIGPTAAELTDRLADALAGIEPTDPRSEQAVLSHLIDARAAQHVHEQVDRAVRHGARPVLRPELDGPWFAPALLADVPEVADVAVDDEIFGPVFTVVPARDDQHALAIANASTLGLTGAVFSADLPRAMAIGAELEVGGVVINGTNNYRPPVVPFGGVGLAGSGREGLGYTLEELTRTRFTAIRGLRAGRVGDGAAHG